MSEISYALAQSVMLSPASILLLYVNSVLRSMEDNSRCSFDFDLVQVVGEGERGSTEVHGSQD